MKWRTNGGDNPTPVTTVDETNEWANELSRMTKSHCTAPYSHGKDSVVSELETINK